MQFLFVINKQDTRVVRDWIRKGSKCQHEFGLNLMNNGKSSQVPQQSINMRENNGALRGLI